MREGIAKGNGTNTIFFINNSVKNMIISVNLLEKVGNTRSIRTLYNPSQKCKLVSLMKLSAFYFECCKSCYDEREMFSRHHARLDREQLDSKLILLLFMHTLYTMCTPFTLGLLFLHNLMVLSTIIVFLLLHLHTSYYHVDNHKQHCINHSGRSKAMR